jgi:hypothetical protein
LIKDSHAQTDLEKAAEALGLLMDADTDDEDEDDIERVLREADL